MSEEQDDGKAPAFDAYDPRRVARVGDVLRWHEDPKGYGVISIHQRGTRAYAVIGAPYGSVTLYADGTLIAPGQWTFCNPPQPETRTGPAPRCGQTWQAGVAFNTMLFEQSFTLLDVDDHGTFSARLDDGRRIPMLTEDFELCAYVSGPTTPESPREAWERVVRLEAETPPDGCSKGAWLAELVNACHEEDALPHRRHMSTIAARETAARLRAEHAAKWARFRGER